MKKSLIFLLVIFLSFFCLNPIYASTTEEDNNSQSIIESSLTGFYDSEFDKFNIYYGDSSIDQKDLFLSETRGYYQKNEFETLYKYCQTNKIAIFHDITPESQTPKLRATDVYPINKSVDVTQWLVEGFPEVKYRVTFGGSYYVDVFANKVTSVKATYKFTRLDNNGFGFAHENDKLSYTTSGLSVTLTLKTTIVVTYSPSATTGRSSKTITAKV